MALELSRAYVLLRNAAVDSSAPPPLVRGMIPETEMAGFCHRGLARGISTLFETRRRDESGEMRRNLEQAWCYGIRCGWSLEQALQELKSCYIDARRPSLTFLLRLPVTLLVTSLGRNTCSVHQSKCYYGVLRIDYYRLPDYRVVDLD